MRKDIATPHGMSPQLRYAIYCLSTAHYADDLDDKIGSVKAAIDALETFIHYTKIHKKRFGPASESEQPFEDDARYVFPENHPPSIVVITANLEKPWVAVDEALEKLGIPHNALMVTEYSYIHDEKEGRLIECRMTLK